MRRPPPGTPGISPEVYAAIEVFTDKELAILEAFYHDTTGEFLFIGFINEASGKVTKWANQPYYDAIGIMEDAIRQEQPYIPRPPAPLPEQLFRRGADGRLYVNWQ